MYGWIRARPCSHIWGVIQLYHSIHMVLTGCRASSHTLDMTYQGLRGESRRDHDKPRWHIRERSKGFSFLSSSRFRSFFLLQEVLSWETEANTWVAYFLRVRRPPLPLSVSPCRQPCTGSSRAGVVVSQPTTSIDFHPVGKVAASHWAAIWADLLTALMGWFLAGGLLCLWAVWLCGGGPAELVAHSWKLRGYIIKYIGQGRGVGGGGWLERERIVSIIWEIHQTLGLI